MALHPELLEELAQLLSESLDKQRTEIVLSTGEDFHEEAMDIARAYMRATGLQRASLHAVVKSWEQRS